MNKLKYHFLGGLIFLGTIVFGYIGYTAYTNLATQVDGATITKDIWNDVINTLNSIGAKTDALETKTSNIYQSGSYTAIGRSNPRGKFDIWNGDLLVTGTDTNGTAYVTSRAGVAYFGNNSYSNGLSILSNGNIGIGTNSSSSNLQIADRYSIDDGFPKLLVGNSNNSGNATVKIVSNDSEDSLQIWDDNVTTTPRFVVKRSGSIGIGISNPSYTLHVNGSVAGTSAFVNTSDIRYKKNISYIDNSLEKVNQLNGVYFDWKTDEYKNMNFKKTKDIGVIAQNVEKVFPEAVSTDKDGYKSVAYGSLVAPIINAIKELYNKYLDQDKIINEQNSKLENQQKQIDKLNENLEKLINYGK